MTAASRDRKRQAARVNLIKQSLTALDSASPLVKMVGHGKGAYYDYESLTEALFNVEQAQGQLATAAAFLHRRVAGMDRRSFGGMKGGRALKPRLKLGGAAPVTQVPGPGSL